MAAEYFTDFKPKLVVLGLGTGKPVSPSQVFDVSLIGIDLWPW